MQLAEKYFVGFSILAVSWIIFFIEGTITNVDMVMIGFIFFLDLPSEQIPSLMSFFLNPVVLIIIGFVTLGIGVLFYVLLFSPEKIKGVSMDFEAAPDLSTFRIIHKDDAKSDEIPETAFCSACGQKIYKPFRCQKCKQLLCGKHYLPGDHVCKEG